MKKIVKVFRSLLPKNWRLMLESRKYQPLFLPTIPLGHYYSPIVSRKDVNEFGKQIWEDSQNAEIDAINLNAEKQVALLKEFERYYPEIPFEEEPNSQTRYHLKNDAYDYTDGIILYSFIRHFQPKRILEVGCGYSSAAMLDIKEVFQTKTTHTFIEPHPELLHSLFRSSDQNDCTLFQKKVQHVQLEEFRKLQSNDILFVDSSHVSKTASDVNHLLFKVLPVLNSGVLIHFHDLFYPFEYPRKWVEGGRNWNEAYLLRAFLSYNDQFEMLHFTDFLQKHFREAFAGMPLAQQHEGSSLWLMKK